VRRMGMWKIRLIMRWTAEELEERRVRSKIVGR
jgi:hypothetical protein